MTFVSHQPSFLLLIEDYNQAYTRAIAALDPAGALPFAEAQRAVFAEQIYYGDAYVRAFASHGSRAEQVIPMCAPLQHRWARERGMWVPPTLLQRGPLRRGWRQFTGLTPHDWGLERIATEQIRAAKPDVLWIFSGIPISRATLERWRPHVGTLLLWWSCPLEPGYPYNQFDLILSCIQPLVDQFQQQGLRAAHVAHAFDPQTQPASAAPRQHAVAFVGNLSAAHRARTVFLDTIAREVGLELYGLGAEHAPPDSPLRSNHRGPAWGKTLYDVYARHTIVVHKNTDVAGSAASAKRLFEATGMGACLVAEASPDLEALFVPGKEIITYRTTEECVARLRELLADPARTAAIAAAGQRRTLRDHTYPQRVGQILELLNPISTKT